MSGHHDKFGRLTQRRALQAASGALRAFRDDLTTSHKGMGWTPRAVVNAHRDELATVCEELGPIVEQRLAREVALDRAEKAEAYPYNGPGQPGMQPIASGGLSVNETSQVRQVADATAEERRLLAEFEAEVRDIYIMNSGNPEAAQRGVVRARAMLATRIALRGGVR